MQNQIEETLSGGYESPIKTVIEEAKTEIDNGVYKAVCQTGIRVDKEELLRALQYDREQYDKGFADGVRQGQQGWISVEEHLPENNGNIITYQGNSQEIGMYYYCGNGEVEDNKGDFASLQYYGITHWMPLPEPPKGE